MTINLYPKPSCAVATSIDMYYWEPLGDAFELDDTFSFPPGYQKALTYNTAVDCQDIFGRQLSQATLAIAAAIYGGDRHTESVERLRHGIPATGTSPQQGPAQQQAQ